MIAGDAVYRTVLADVYCTVLAAGIGVLLCIARRRYADIAAIPADAHRGKFAGLAGADRGTKFDGGKATSVTVFIVEHRPSPLELAGMVAQKTLLTDASGARRGEEDSTGARR